MFDISNLSRFRQLATLAPLTSACDGPANGGRASTGEQLTIGIKIYWAADGRLQLAAPRPARST
jgi:hypothetical protein